MCRGVFATRSYGIRVEDNVLNTSRLQLRPTSPLMFDALWEAIEISQPDLSRWLPWAVDPDPAATLQFLETAAESWTSGRDRHFTILRDGKPCGQCSLDHLDPWGRGAEMGYWMRSDMCGQGLMTEAAAAVANFGFYSEALHRIELHAGVDNNASCRVAEKIGFRREGLLRHAGRGRDGFYDSYVYGLLVIDPRGK